MWKSFILSKIELPEHTIYGWNDDFNIKASGESFAEELSEVVKVDEMYGADKESDSDSVFVLMNRNLGKNVPLFSAT